ncbi:DUF4271 domain-containing protein [Carboxylicivirga sp. N1Y90]|uniref:DUF4271 domain-containing protein n=1 Tax=Carboxylicivirga fragile TaxID=3417571 RepID=UPI003D324B8D|nr:DUF4271 domain-containing protein [Marinilabiliaceae bacterium N1Y90]
MSLQNTISTPQNETSTPTLQLSKDSLNLGNSFRTHIMQIDMEKPAHLSQTNTYKPVPKLKYQFLSHEDSIFLNLIQADEGIFQNTLDHSISVQSSEEFVEEEAITIKNTSNHTNDTSSAEIVKIEKPSQRLSETTLKTNAVKSRKSNAFTDSKDWLSGFILLTLIIAGLVKISAGKYINEIFSAVRYQQSASKLFSSFNLQNQKPGWALSTLFVLTSSLLIFEYTLIFGKTPSSFSKHVFLLAIIGGVLLYFGIKTILYRIVSFIFETSADTNEYIFNADILSKAFGITLLPIVSVIPFVDYLTSTYLLKAGLALFLIMYTIQLLRGVKIILRSPLSIFYMFLYFCALEILPLSILIKLLIL